MNLTLILKNFLDENMRLKAFPARRKMKIYALIYLAGKFEKDREYSEKEAGAVLNAWHTFSDPATLRREMYDYGFLDRSRDGRVYKMSENQPTFAQLGLLEE